MTTQAELIAKIRGLTKKQQEVLGAICMNEDSGHHTATVAALEKAGLITRRRERLAGHPPVDVFRLDYSPEVHMAWCAWCAEQPDDPDDGAAGAPG